MVRSDLSVSPNCSNPDDTLRELKLGYLNIKDGFFDLAQTNFDLVIIADKTCADAFWGLTLCRLEVTDEAEFSKRPEEFTQIFTLKEYQNAMKYANEKQKSRFENYVKDIPNKPKDEDDKKVNVFNFNSDF